MSGKGAKRLGLDALKNPFFIFALTVLASIFIVYIAKSQETRIGTVWSEVINTVGAAVLTSGTFGLWFDYFGKRKLLSEVVQDALGQSRCLSAGITDFQLKVVDIDEKDAFRSSAQMVVGVRRSAKLLDRYKDDIRYRLHGGKGLTIIRQKDASMFPTATGYSALPDDFVRSLEAAEPGITAKIEIYETDELMSYNFVQSDQGIWVKMYFNATQPELPPAIFVSNGSPVQQRFATDIEKLVSNGVRIYP